MRKFDCMSRLYVKGCMDYIKEKPESAKENLENILFLLQYDSLQDKKNKKPFIPYKIYIDGDVIRIRFISDLFQVIKTMGNYWIGARGSFPPIPWHGPTDEYKYMNLLEKYKSLPIEQIKLRVNEIMKSENLDSKYFIYGKYDDKFMRKIARFLAYGENNFYKEKLFWFVLMIIVVCFGVLLTLPHYEDIIVYDMNTLYTGFIMGAGIGIVIWFIWIWKIVMTPTQFEMDNDYVNK